jgi:hypothetical protein
MKICEVDQKKKKKKKRKKRKGVLKLREYFSKENCYSYEKKKKRKRKIPQQNILLSFSTEQYSIIISDKITDISLLLEPYLHFDSQCFKSDLRLLLEFY